MKKLRLKDAITILFVLGIIGLITSGYLTYLHFHEDEKSGVCVIDQQGLSSCSIVNSSEFSKILGIPAGILGMAWFAIMLFLVWDVHRKKELINRLFYWNVIGLLSIMYFIYGEFVLRTVCTYCTVVHIVVVVSLIISVVMVRKIRPQKVTSHDN